MTGRAALASAMVAVAMLIPTCTSSPGDFSDLYFPTHAPSDESPLGILMGEVDLSNGCIFVVAQDVRYLPVWPESWSFDEEQVRIVDSAGQSVASDGETVRLGGGEKTLSEAIGFIGEDIPSRCQAGRYWYATGA